MYKARCQCSHRTKRCTVVHFTAGACMNLENCRSGLRLPFGVPILTCLSYMFSRYISNALGKDEKCIMCWDLGYQEEGSRTWKDWL